MASGDTVFSGANMCLELDESEPNDNITKLRVPGPGAGVTVEIPGSGVNETVFDASLTYDVVIKEH